jgi:hypothetical protein
MGISLVLSGGSSNIDPTKSIGGDPSRNPIPDNKLNNLFSDVSQADTDETKTDFRCVYLFNDTSYPLKNIKSWIFYDFRAGADISMGIDSRNESQKIILQGAPSRGQFTLSYYNRPFTVKFIQSPTGMAASLQDAILGLKDTNNVNLFNDVSVTGDRVNNNTILTITFTGNDANRGYDLPGLIDNSLVPSVPINISRVFAGSPINTVATLLSSSAIEPGNVNFYPAAVDSPIVLPRLEIGDGFPLWIKRVVAQGTLPVANDGFTLRVVADAIGLQ